MEELNLTVRRGWIYGFLGPNGAGKTTAMGMIMGLVRPTRGRVELFGEPVGAGTHHVYRRIGAVVQGPVFYPYLSAHDNLRVLAEVTGRVGPPRIAAALDRVGLLDRARDRFSTFSLGMKQRLALAAALLHEPELLVLDEPTNGLDPAGMHEVRELIRSLAREGKTIFLSSHLLHEVEQLCDHVGIIQGGRLVLEGSVEDLAQAARGFRLELGTHEEARRALERLQGLPWVRQASLNGMGLNGNGGVRLDPTRTLWVEAAADQGARLTESLAEAGLFVTALVPVQASLEDFFLEVTSHGDVAAPPVR
ncbi:ABC transporter ATP-binding protein [Limnochorda pilosa]|uniref:ABC transporter ATP-binding protein n=1 Tax=Limnochorda pilosa TaxID=1555112 RepID=A0A0K2SIP0_LIMPI|nr:ABC transporter ATP-binding protein [Limnochorda pilosa]BAS26892.1 ABC transporter ATP-binding protein [Limnochorda pilosa]